MAEVKKIGHEGIVKSVSEQTIEVMITSSSACATCHAKGACGMSETSQKIITALRPDFEISTGDKITVYATTHNAAYSVILAYVLPSVLLIAGITVLVSFKISETLAAAGALAILAIYYTGLYLNRDKIGKKIIFTVEKQNA